MKITNAKKIHFFSILLGLLVVVFDQTVKLAILEFVPLGEVIKICPYINLTLIFNRGTSFGLMEPNTIIEYYMIIFLTILCVLFLVYVFCKFKTITEKVLCGILIGGAFGNLLDRFLRGAVVDFLDIYYKEFHWPAFNFADAAISCSVIVLLLYNLFSKKIS